jgi:hypothetical protein
VPTVGPGAVQQVVFEHQGRHPVGAGDLDPRFERRHVHVSLEQLERRDDLAVAAGTG